jgi:hypothetical protein
MAEGVAEGVAEGRGQVYAEVRAELESGEAAAQSPEAARPDPLTERGLW